MELVVAKIKGGIDGFERLEVYIQLLFFAVLRDNSACVYDEAIGGHLQHSANQKQTLLLFADKVNLHALFTAKEDV